MLLQTSNIKYIKNNNNDNNIDKMKQIKGQKKDICIQGQYPLPFKGNYKNSQRVGGQASIHCSSESEQSFTQSYVHIQCIYIKTGLSDTATVAWRGPGGKVRQGVAKLLTQQENEGINKNIAM